MRNNPRKLDGLDTAVLIGLIAAMAMALGLISTVLA